MCSCGVFYGIRLLFRTSFSVAVMALRLGRVVGGLPLASRVPPLYSAVVSLRGKGGRARAAVLALGEHGSRSQDPPE